MKNITLNIILSIILLSPICLLGQSSIVLPTDGSSSSELTPQGAINYQRIFYLITPAEAQSSDLPNNSIINSLGFTMVEAPDSRSEGRLRIYLQNTTDSEARSDTIWTIIDSVMSSSTQLVNLLSGNYEWQVQSVCDGSVSEYSDAIQFNTDLDPCNSPVNLVTSDITANSAILNWEIPFSSGFQDFVVEYSLLDLQNPLNIVWVSDTVTATTLNLNGLIAGKTYQWRVKTVCSNTTTFPTGSSFTTKSILCEPITTADSAQVLSSKVTFSWSTADTAVNYELQYRRIGSLEWNKITSGSNVKSIDYISISTITNDTIINFENGTLYEWRVRSYCGFTASFSPKVGEYTYGPDFRTLGAPTCFIPINTRSGNIDNSSATVSWLANPDASFYKLRYRLKQSISWSRAIDSMVCVNDNVISIPDSIGPFNISLKGDTIYKDSISIKLRAILNGNNVVLQPIITTDSFRVDTLLRTYEKTNSGYVLQNTYGIILDYEIDTIAADSFLVSFSRSIDGSPLSLVSFPANDVELTGSLLTLYLGTPGNLTVDQEIQLNLQVMPNRFEVVDSIIAVESFSYSGNGIYVALEYTNQENSLGSFNKTLSNEKKLNTSSQNKFSLSYKADIDFSDTAHSERLLSTSKRPETRLGSGSLSDIGEVVNVFTLGQNAVEWGNPVEVSAIVRNNSDTVQLLTVSLSIIDKKSKTVKTNSMYFVSLGSKEDTLIKENFLFDTLSTDSISVTVDPVAGENVIYNNQKDYIINNNTSTLAYDDGSEQVASTGLDQPGLILVRHKINGCGSINSVKVFLDRTAANKETYGVVLNSSGMIVDESLHFIPDSSQTQKYNSFFFPNLPNFQDEEFYVGLAQTNTGYKPVGIQWETEDIRENAYYRARINGDTLKEQRLPGRLMIRTEIVNSNAVPVIIGDQFLCDADTITLSVGSKTERFANRVIDFSSERSNSGFSAKEALGSPDVFPVHSNSNTGQWVGKSTDVNREFISLGFPDPGPANFIDIYQTSNPGAVDTVYVFDTSGAKTLVFSRFLNSDTLQDEDSIDAKIQHISFPIISTPVASVYIKLAADSIQGGNGIDAVSIGVISDMAQNNSYLWSPGNDTTPSIDVHQSGEYSVQVEDSFGCNYEASIKIKDHVSVNPTLSLDSGQVATFCDGDFVKINSSQSSGNNWYTVDSSLQKFSSSIIVEETGEYFVLYDDGADCGLNSSDTISIHVNDLPVPTISGLLTLCPNGTVTLNAPSGFVTYDWSNGDSMTSSISVSQADDYSVTVTDINGCSGSFDTTVVDGPPPSPNISGPSTICPGSNNSLIADSGYLNYIWSSGESTQLINITVGDVYSVTVTDINNCVGNSSKTVGEFTLPTPAITGIFGFCPGDSTDIGVSNIYTSYVWSSGETTKNITVNAAGIYSVTVTDTNGCEGITSVNVIEFDIPQPVIGGTLSFCGGNVTTLNAGSGYASYLWSTGDTTQSIMIDSAQEYSVTVTDFNGCKGDAVVDVTQTGTLPGTPGPISGLRYGLCNTDSVVYSIAPVVNTNFYVWTVPAGATIVSGQGSTSIVVDYNNIDSGDIVVAASNACGQSPSANPRKLKVYGGPSQPGTIMGQANGLCSNMGIQYWIDPVTNSSSYTWTVPSNVTIVSGQGTPMITVNLNMLSGQIGTICATANNSCGNSISSCLDVLMLISDPILPVAMCKNTSVALNAQGGASITTSDINNGSTDNCGIANMSLSKSNFGCMDIGNNSVVLTVTDNFSNISTCTANVSVSDPTLNCPCFTPGGLTADNLKLNSARLNWTPTPNAQAYRLYGERLGFPPIDFTLSNGATSSYNANNLNLKTFYYWSIQAICDAGGGSTRTSSIASPDTFKTAACTNPKNTQTTLLLGNPKQATLTWNPTPFAAGYRLIGQKAGSTQQSIDLNGNSNTSFFTNTLETNTTYMWIVLSGCVSKGSVVFSNSATATINTFTTGNSVSQKQFMAEDGLGLSLWPNPTETVVHLKIDGATSDENWTVRIYNVAGEEVMTFDHMSSSNFSEITVQKLASGIYQVMAINGDQILKEKLVISR